MATEDIIKINNNQYKLIHDEAVGDWCVVSEDKNIQGDYIMTKRGAINYILQDSGLLMTDSYRFSPDRC